MRNFPDAPAHTFPDESDVPVLISLLGSFGLRKHGQLLTVRGGKTGALLGCLALHPGRPVARELLLSALWPSSDLELANRALNSLVHHFRKLVGDAVADDPIICANGYYELKIDGGIGVDLVLFEALAQSGDRHRAVGDSAAAMVAYARAISLYRGDLCYAYNVEAVIERERLHARYLSLLAHAADERYSAGDWAGCLEFALRLLASEPCREDAHRQAMRCYVKQGERAQALRQYRLCQEILRQEFDADVEPETAALYDQVRRDPGHV